MSHYCSNCGTVCDDGKPYCSNCGVPQQPYSQKPYQQAPNRSYQPVSNQPYGGSNELPMKWFKFVIYFQLFANCVMNAISAISTFSGGQYQGNAELVYSYIDGLKGVDTIYGVLLLGLAVFAIIARTRLAKFCVDGPKSYHILLVAQMAVSVFYIIAVNSAVSNSFIAAYYEPDYTSVIGSLVGTGAMLACNIAYFKKRIHLFVNN